MVSSQKDYETKTVVQQKLETIQSSQKLFLLNLKKKMGLEEWTSTRKVGEWGISGVGVRAAGGEADAAAGGDGRGAVRDVPGGGAAVHGGVQPADAEAARAVLDGAAVIGGRGVTG